MWHDSDRAYTLALTKLNNSGIDPQEKQAIQTIHNELLAEGLGKHRVIKYLQVLRLILERGAVPYHSMTKEDLYSTIADIKHRWNLGPDAQRDYLISLRKILQYHGKDNLTPLITIKKPPKGNNINPSDTLNIHDILNLLKTCKNPRDAAIITSLFESDARPGEFFNLKWQDLTYEQMPVKMWNGNGKMIAKNIDVIFLKLNGKTGPRRPFLFFSVPWIMAWKKAYPHGASGHLWVDLEGELEQLKYHTARKILNTLIKRSGLKKHIKLYSFRHGRNTEVSEVLTSAQQCEYAGWKQGSDMPQVYNHLTGLEMLTPILGEFGIIINRRQSIRSAWLQLYREGMEQFNKLK